ncbi:MULTISPECIES: Maf family protein [Bacillus]|uniref:Maf family protein n=1 Tax=Bacillus TaxID=1386 RepID=UPI000BB6DB0A|nr:MULTISPECIES: Maf family protein [Bacillus]
MKRLILASGSPRRKELLEQINLSFEIIASKVEETFDPKESPENIAMSLASQKASDVFTQNQDSIVIGADTIVVFNNEILGKPNDEEDAFRMLKKLSGQTHHVITGVAIISSEKEKIFYEKTTVTFYELTEKELKDYIASKEPMDKAGSYGIQQLGALFVQKIDGDYFSVVGLPIAKTMRELSTFQ